MQVLVDRLTEAGLRAVVFGHPARLPGDGNVLVAAGSALLSALTGLVWAEVGRLAGLGAVALGALLLFGLELWPRAPAWTVIVGQPGPHVRRVQVLALDVRRAHRWPYLLAMASAASVAIAPGSSFSVVVAMVAAGACIVARGRPRELAVEAAVEWVRRRAQAPDVLVLVSTAASAFGEGVSCVLDWYHVDGARLGVEIDEEVPSGVVARLRAQGIGAAPEEAPHVVAADRAGG
jgi:hypothetical protein